MREVRDKFNGLGLKRKSGRELAVSNYQKLLKNPIYTGLMRYNGEIFEGKHEPIITKKLFDSVQEVMSRKSKPHSKGLKPYIYRGFFRCGECGCFITTEQQKGHNYLRCTKRKNPCSQKYIREELITSQIQKEIKKVSLPLDWTKWMIAENEKSAIGSPIEYAFCRFNKSRHFSFGFQNREADECLSRKCIVARRIS